VQWVEQQDVARAALGHGWPVAAGPRSNDGARGPAAGGPDAWGKTFCLLLGRLPKVSRRKGGTVRSGNKKAALKCQIENNSLAGGSRSIRLAAFPTSMWVLKPLLRELDRSGWRACMTAAASLRGQVRLCQSKTLGFELRAVGGRLDSRSA